MSQSLSIVMIVLLLLFVPLTLSGPARAVKDPFVGAWESIDPDGSFQTLTIGGLEEIGYRFVWFDRGGTICGEFDEDGNPTIPAMFRGTGTRTGPITLEITGDIECLYRDARGVELIFSGATVTLGYDSGTDTLDNFWHRMGP